LTPWLSIDFAGPRCVETVTLDGDVSNLAREFRVRVRNRWLGTARNCSVMLDSLHFNGQNIFPESSPMEWCDTDTFAPQRILGGKTRYANFVRVFATQQPSAAIVRSEIGVKMIGGIPVGLIAADISVHADFAIPRRARVILSHDGWSSQFI